MEKIEWHNERRKLHELVPATYNPRKLQKKAYDDLRKSLEKFNLADLPSINTDNTIISGHQRVRVMVDIYGRDFEIDVRVPNRLLDKKEEKELNIRANKNLGEWDWDLLGNEFELDDLLEFGFTETDLPFLNADGEEGEQGKLDEFSPKEDITCPECGHIWTP